MGLLCSRHLFVSSPTPYPSLHLPQRVSKDSQWKISQVQHHCLLHKRVAPASYLLTGVVFSPSILKADGIRLIEYQLAAFVEISVVNDTTTVAVTWWA